MNTPKIGDLIFTRWHGWSARVTIWVTRGLAAHQEQVCQDGESVHVIAASGLMNRMNVWEWQSRKAYFRKTGTAWARFTLTKPLDDKERVRLRDFFEEAINEFRYSKGELLLQGLDALKNWITRTDRLDPRAVWFRKAGDWIKSGVICSKVANQGLADLGILPAHAIYWSPADTLYHVSASHEWIMAEATPHFFGPGVPPEEEPPQ